MQTARQIRKAEAARPLLRARWQWWLIWTSWLVWIASMIRNSSQVYMGYAEFGTLFLAAAISIVCNIYRFGKPAIYITKPEQIPGNEFVSRTKWALVIVGVAFTVAGIAGSMKFIEDMSNGIASRGSIFMDSTRFVMGWIMEIISGGMWDGELEKTRGYIFVLALPIGLLTTYMTLLPLIHRGYRFRVETDGTIFYLRDKAWQQLQDTDFAEITADAIELKLFKEAGTAAAPHEEPKPPPRHAEITLPQTRVFASNLGTRVTAHVIAAYFRQRLEKLGYIVETTTEEGMRESSWIARRAAHASVQKV